MMNILIFRAFSRIPIGIATAIEVLGPISVALINARRRSDLIWVFLAVVGLALLLPLRTDSQIDVLGLLFALGAAACWADMDVDISGLVADVVAQSEPADPPHRALPDALLELKRLRLVQEAVKKITSAAVKRPREQDISL
jgi:drug/metabolite transporter (DMT)-like permease